MRHQNGPRRLQAQELDPAVAKSFSWAIVLAGTGTVIGLAQLSSIDYYEGAEPAVFLDPERRGEGYGLERDRAGRYFRLEDCAGTLRHPDLQAAVDGLLGRLLAHTRRKLDDDVALLLLEATSRSHASPSRHMIATRHQHAQQTYH